MSPECVRPDVRVAHSRLSSPAKRGFPPWGEIGLVFITPGATEFVMAKGYSIGFRKSMIHRIVGPGARSAMSLSREVGVTQGTLSRWLRMSTRLEGMDSNKHGSGDDDRTSRSPQK